MGHRTNLILGCLSFLGKSDIFSWISMRFTWKVDYFTKLQRCESGCKDLDCEWKIPSFNSM